MYLTGLSIVTGQHVAWCICQTYASMVHCLDAFVDPISWTASFVSMHHCIDVLGYCALYCCTGKGRACYPPSHAAVLIITFIQKM